MSDSSQGGSNRNGEAWRCSLVSGVILETQIWLDMLSMRCLSETPVKMFDRLPYLKLSSVENYHSYL